MRELVRCTRCGDALAKEEAEMVDMEPVRDRVGIDIVGWTWGWAHEACASSTNQKPTGVGIRAGNPTQEAPELHWNQEGEA